MPGTYSQIHIQIVFAVKYRQALIMPAWEDELYKYITGIITNKGQKLLAINGMPDHIHILIGMKPSCCLSDLVREVKKASTEFIKEMKFTPSNFRWQEGFGAVLLFFSSLLDFLKFKKSFSKLSYEGHGVCEGVCDFKENIDCDFTYLE
jgi:REP element-mobilizing transposase RayT